MRAKVFEKMQVPAVINCIAAGEEHAAMQALAGVACTST
jgi:hypothetical protein